MNATNDSSSIKININVLLHGDHFSRGRLSDAYLYCNKVIPSYYGSDQNPHVISVNAHISDKVTLSAFIRYCQVMFSSPPAAREKVTQQSADGRGFSSGIVRFPFPYNADALWKQSSKAEYLYNGSRDVLHG